MSVEKYNPYLTLDPSKPYPVNRLKWEISILHPKRVGDFSYPSFHRGNKLMMAKEKGGVYPPLLTLPNAWDQFINGSLVLIQPQSGAPIKAPAMKATKPKQMAPTVLLKKSNIVTSFIGNRRLQTNG